MLIDAFMFANELDILELRLRETEDVVAKWVLVESVDTHSGLLKPLVFHDNRKRFERWKDRIIHHAIRLPQETNDERENAHRRAVGEAVSKLDLKPTDIVHTSDLDEIPAEQTLRNFAAHPEIGLSCIETYHSYFWLNCVKGGWGACRLGTWEQILAETAGDFQHLRHIGRDLPILRSKHDVPYSGGWHLSFMGGIGQIQQKLAWYLHSDAYQRHVIDPRWLHFCINTGTNIFFALHEDQGQDFFRFVTPPVLPRAIAQFPQFYAPNVRFFYHQNPTQLQEVWRTVCGRQMTDGVIMDLSTTDGMSAAAMAAGCRQCIMVICSPEHSLQVCASMEGLGVNAMVHNKRAFDFWETWKGPISFCNVNSDNESIPHVLKWLSPGGTVCGYAFPEQFRDWLRGMRNYGYFWSWRKP